MAKHVHPDSLRTYKQTLPGTILLQDEKKPLLKCAIHHRYTKHGLETALRFSGGFRIMHTLRAN